jgi:hypothetical protein
MTDGTLFLADYRFIAGSKKRFFFNCKDADGNYVDISSATSVKLVMWPYGQSSGSATLTKTGTKTGSAVNYQFYVDFSTNDTKNLTTGLYQYQPVVVDIAGDEIRDTLGKFIIESRIP